MKGVPKRFENDLTGAQAKRLKEIRDCPDRDCDGHLERIDMWLDDDVIHERYQHHGGSDHESCSCDGSADGRLSRHGGDIVASHYETGQSKGHGCLKGVFGR